MNTDNTKQSKNETEESVDDIGRSQLETELSFSDLIRIAFDNRGKILGTAILVFLLAVIYLNFATPHYSAEIRLTAVQQNTQGLSSRLNGLASIAGIDLQQDQAVSPFTLFIEGIKSRQTAMELAQNPLVMRTIFESQWNDEKRSWVEPSGIKYSIVKVIKVIFGDRSSEWRSPGAAELESYLISSVNVDQRPGEPIVSIQFSHPDPEFARLFVRELHKITDEFLRKRTLIRTEEYIDYLTDQMNSVTVAEHRQALAAAFSEQEKLKMMANSGLPFAAEPFGPVAVSSHPVSPKPIPVLVSSIIFGLLIGAGIIGGSHVVSEIKASR